MTSRLFCFQQQGVSENAPVFNYELCTRYHGAAMFLESDMICIRAGTEFAQEHRIAVRVAISLDQRHIQAICLWFALVQQADKAGRTTRLKWGRREGGDRRAFSQLNARPVAGNGGGGEATGIFFEFCSCLIRTF